ncbi:MAG: hypothetical protein F7C38_02650 [Desulfurococcales archaeon]|nr:hypothetical protein [Desulfurococcales archaeon]
MYKYILIPAILLLALATPIQPVHAQSYHWYKDIESLSGGTYGITHDDQYLYAAGSLASGSYRDLFVAKIDPLSGQFQWIRSLNPSPIYNEYIHDIDYLDGYLYIVGCSDSFSGDRSTEIIIARINTIGAMDWLVRISQTTNDCAYSVEATANGIYVAGKIGVNNDDILVMKLGSDGSIIWAKAYGGGSSDFGYGIEYLNGYLYVVGKTSSFGGYYEGFIMKLDPQDGSVVWSKKFGGLSGDDVAYGVTGNDTYLFITGYTYSYGQGYSDGFLFKVDENGNFIWFITMGEGGYDFTNQTIVVGNKLFVTGHTKSFNENGKYNYTVYELDKDGNLISARTMGSSADEKMYSATLYNSLIYIGGNSNLRSPYFYDPTILMYSPSLGELSWTGGEGWESLTASDCSPTISSIALEDSGFNGITLTVTSLTPSQDSVTDYSFSPISPVIHTAVDNTEPQPVPENPMIPAIMIAWILLAIALGKRAARP